MPDKTPLGLFHAPGNAKVGKLRDAKPRIATGIDPREGFQIHVDVEGQAVIAATLADPKTEGREFFPRHVDTRGGLFPDGLDTRLPGQIDHGLLQRRHQPARAHFPPAKVKQYVDHQLTGTVIGNLSAPVGARHGNRARIQDMFRAPGLTQGKDGRMLDQPDLVYRRRPPGIGKCPHGLPDGMVFRLSKMPNDFLPQGYCFARLFEGDVTSGLNDQTGDPRRGQMIGIDDQIVMARVIVVALE